MNITKWFTTLCSRDDNIDKFIEACRLSGMDDPDTIIAHIGIAIERERLKEAEQHTKQATHEATVAELAVVRTNMLLRPSRMYNVTLTHDGLEWLCRLSTGSDPRADLVGRGHCPEAAMVNFDSIWFGCEGETP